MGVFGHRRINDNREKERIENLIHFVANMIALSGYHGSTRMPLWEHGWTNPIILHSVLSKTTFTFFLFFSLSLSLSPWSFSLFLYLFPQGYSFTGLYFVNVQACFFSSRVSKLIPYPWVTDAIDTTTQPRYKIVIVGGGGKYKTWLSRRPNSLIMTNSRCRQICPDDPVYSIALCWWVWPDYWR